MKYHPVQTHVVHDVATNTVEYLTDSGLTLHPNPNVVHTAECKKDAVDWVSQQVLGYFIKPGDHHVSFYVMGDGTMVDTKLYATEDEAERALVAK